MTIFFAPSVRVSLSQTPPVTFAKANITKFVCDICAEIVNAPVECDNTECGQLYCSYCLNMKLYDKNLQEEQKECEVCKKVNGGYRQPSALIMKMLSTYFIKCLTCNKPFDMKNLIQHEIMCQ